jgi:hypothetical protein
LKAVISVASATIVHYLSLMNEKEFKKHLKDLAHGRHHPEEHDWAPDTNVRKTENRVAARGAKSSAAQKAKRRSK